jgi:hypothetical protein
MCDMDRGQLAGKGERPYSSGKSISEPSAQTLRTLIRVMGIFAIGLRS